MNCGETAGFLFRHECGREADATCQLCGKAICALHTRPVQAQILCIDCVKRAYPMGPPEQPAPGADAQPAQPAVPGQPGAPAQPPGTQPRSTPYDSPWYTYDDPYWYTSSHYPRYHHTDFTTADRQAFEPQAAGAGKGADDAFETDPSAS